MRGRFPIQAIGAAALALSGCVPACAADLSAQAAIVSDYRFRGLSLSDRKPALQGGVDLALGRGWSIGTWGSTIDKYGGAHVETDLYAARTGTVAGLDYGVTAYMYVYPGGHDVNYGEVQGELGRTIGPLTLAVEGAFSPHQRNTGCHNLYLGARAALAIPATPLSVTVRGGREDGFYDRKLDWELGIAFARGPLTLSASVVGTNRGGAGEIGRMARGGAILSALASF